MEPNSEELYITFLPAAMEVTVTVFLNKVSTPALLPKLGNWKCSLFPTTPGHRYKDSDFILGWDRSSEVEHMLCRPKVPGEIPNYLQVGIGKTSGQLKPISV